MMKIWKDSKTEPEYFLRLIEEDGKPTLVMVDTAGDKVLGGVLALINSNGYLVLPNNINNNVARAMGIALDENRRVIIHD